MMGGETHQHWLEPMVVEQAWLDICPGCKQRVSAIKHDFSLCTRLANSDYRIRQLEGQVEQLQQNYDDLILLLKSEVQANQARRLMQQRGTPGRPPAAPPNSFPVG